VFLHWWDNRIRGWEAKKMGKPIPWNTNITSRALYTTHSPSTATGTDPGHMELGANQSTLTVKGHQ
jgi:hypothetical protein